MKFLLFIILILLISCKKDGIKSEVSTKKYTTLSCGSDKANLTHKIVDRAYYLDNLDFKFYLNKKEYFTSENCQISITYKKSYEMANIECKDTAKSVKGPFKEYNIEDDTITAYSINRGSVSRNKRDCLITWEQINKEETDIEVSLTRWTPLTKSKERARREQEREKERQKQRDEDDEALFLLGVGVATGLI